jgi:hypothetical protein
LANSGEHISNQLGANFKTINARDCPHTIITEENVNEPDIYGCEKTLGQIGGGAAHEMGHVKDMLINPSKFDFDSVESPIKFCALRVRAEYAAETNALDAGYDSEIFAVRMNFMRAFGSEFFRQTAKYADMLGITAYQAAFMQSEKADESRKRVLKSAWDAIVERARDPIKTVAGNRDVNERPAMFGDEKYLEKLMEQHISKFCPGQEMKFRQFSQTKPG